MCFAHVEDRVPEGGDLLLLDEELVVRVVDLGDVEVLDGDEVVLDQGYVVVLLPLEHAHDPRVVDPRGQDDEQVRQERRLLRQVERERLVVDLNVGHPDDDVLELGVLVRVRGSLHHREGGVVKLVVLDVQEHELRPQMGLLGRSDHLGQVGPGPEQLEVLHHWRANSKKRTFS